MATIDHLRNSIIDKLLTINNKEYLEGLYKLVSNSRIDSDMVHLTEEQKVMLQLSEEDIKFGRLIPQDDLDKQDLKWLEGL
ncbi:hypothetical protein BH24BAC1_BH24BAC1_14700 [soil metagenome]